MMDVTPTHEPSSLAHDDAAEARGMKVSMADSFEVWRAVMVAA